MAGWQCTSFGSLRLTGSPTNPNPNPNPNPETTAGRGKEAHDTNAIFVEKASTAALISQLRLCRALLPSCGTTQISFCISVETTCLERAGFLAGLISVGDIMWF